MPGAVDARAFLLTLASAAAANTVAMAFYPAMSLTPGRRRAAWLACTLAVALSPCAVPVRTAWRMAAALVSVALVLKLYDLEDVAARGMRIGFRSYAGYLPNWFWLVLRRPPRPGPQPGDVRSLMLGGTATVLAIAGLIASYRADWQQIPFLLEHTAKAGLLVLMMIFGANAFAAAWRLSGARAMVPMRSPWAAVTPADFWRRWNRPTQQFLYQYVYHRLGGARGPVAAGVATFIVSGVIHEALFDLCAGRVTGWQMAYFTLHGVAAVATANVRPRGPARRLWTAGTLAFGFATTLLLGATLNEIVGFYCPRGGR